MHPGVGLAIFALAVAPLVSAVDFGFYRRVARHKPSLAWLPGLLVPFVLLVIAAAAHAPVLSAVALALSAVTTIGWLVRRSRRR